MLKTYLQKKEEKSGYTSCNDYVAFPRNFWKIEEMYTLGRI